jgi:hypothetical protein
MNQLPKDIIFDEESKFSITENRLLDLGGMEFKKNKCCKKYKKHKRCKSCPKG